MPVEYLQKDDASMPGSPSKPCPLSKLTGFQRDILFVVVHLDGTQPNGMTIKGELQEVYGEKINHSRLYQNLHDLFEEGLIEKRPLDGRTNAYRVSEPASEYLEVHASWQEQCLLDDDDKVGEATLRDE